MNLIATVLMRTSAVFVSGLTMTIWWKTPALTGYSVHERDGCMKSALTMTYAMMLMAMICCVHFAVFDCIVVYYLVCINSDFVT